MALESYEQVLAAIKTQDIEALVALGPKALHEISLDEALLLAAVGPEHVGEETVYKALARVRGLVNTVWFWTYTSQQLKKPIPVDQIRRSLEPKEATPVDPNAGTYGII